MFDDTMSPIYDDEYDIFSPPTIEDIVYVDYDMPPIYDVYNDEYDIFSPTTIEDKVDYDYTMPAIYDDYNDGCDSFTVGCMPKRQCIYTSDSIIMICVLYAITAVVPEYVIRSKAHSHV